MEPPGALCLEVEVADAAGTWQVRELEVPRGATVGQLKEALAASLGVPQHCQLPSLGPLHLDDDDQRLEELEVHSGSRVHLTDFGPLHPEVREAPCHIPETERRGITLGQLRGLLRFLRLRCGKEQALRGWFESSRQSREAYGSALKLASLNLYQLASWLIRPATSSWRCSFVELVARSGEEQRPRWFVSHAWSEPVLHFVSCLEEHARLRHLSDADAWWVCAYANNQHELGRDLTRDPRETSFYRAMQLSRGVVLVLDEAATPFVRVWCCFEESVALSESERAERLLLDIATVHEGQAQVLTDGASEEDLAKKQASLFRKIEHYEMSIKAHRESTFPLALVLKAFDKIDVWHASSSNAADKRRILNSIAGRKAALLDEEPVGRHPRYGEVDGALRAVFALAVLPGCAKQGLLKELARVAEVLSRDAAKREELQLNLSDMAELQDQVLWQVAAALPPGLQSLSLSCTRCTRLTDTALSALAKHLPPELHFLKVSFHGVRELTDAGPLALAQKLPGSLRELRLSFGDCHRLTAGALCRLAEGLPPQLEKLYMGLEGCTAISDAGFQALGRRLASTLRTLELNLMGCHALGNPGLAALGHGLPQALSTLRLGIFSCHLVGDAGFAALARHLPAGLKALQLDVRACSVGEAGVAALAACRPQGLRELEVLFSGPDFAAVRLSSTQEIDAWWATCSTEPFARPRQSSRPNSSSRLTRSRGACRPFKAGGP